MHQSLFLKEECFDFIVSEWISIQFSEDFQALPFELQKEVKEFMQAKAQRRALFLQKTKGNNPSSSFSL